MFCEASGRLIDICVPSDLVFSLQRVYQLIRAQITESTTILGDPRGCSNDGYVCAEKQGGGQYWQSGYTGIGNDCLHS